MKDIFIMKKIFLTIIAIAALFFSSCSNKVDLYCYDGDSTIVYAMLDANADTNFFKITHSFVGDVSQLAHNYDANNYKYDDIEVTFSGVFDGSNQTQTFTLDTISKWIPYDENSQFYSGCRQTYYYSTHKLKEGTEYTVNVLRKEDGVYITAKTMTINDFRAKKPLDGQALQFYEVKRGTVEWRVRDFPFISTAAYFEVDAFFHYKELMPGSTDTTYRYAYWPLGSDKAENLLTTQNNDTYYVMNYTPEALLTVLKDNQYLKENSPNGVQRFYDKFEIKVSAIGEELYNYYLATNSTSAIQDVPNYTNVENGMGIVSSRISKSTFHRVRQLTRNKIEERFPEYGFVHDPNQP